MFDFYEVNVCSEKVNLYLGYFKDLIIVYKIIVKRNIKENRPIIKYPELVQTLKEQNEAYMDDVIIIGHKFKDKEFN